MENGGRGGWRMNMLIWEFWHMATMMYDILSVYILNHQS